MITAATQDQKGGGISVYTEDVQRTRLICVTGEEVLTGFTGYTVTTLDKKIGSGRIYSEEGHMIRFITVKPQEDEKEHNSGSSIYIHRNQDYASVAFNFVMLVIAIAFFYTFGHQIMVTGCTPLSALMYAIGVFVLGGLVITFVLILLFYTFAKIKKSILK